MSSSQYLASCWLDPRSPPAHNQPTFETNNDDAAAVRNPGEQATKALTKEAKRVKTFLLQQAIRKSKAAAEKKGKKTNNEKAVEAEGEPVEEKEEGEKQQEEETPSPADVDAGGGLAASSQEVLLIKVK